MTQTDKSIPVEKKTVSLRLAVYFSLLGFAFSAGTVSATESTATNAPDQLKVLTLNFNSEIVPDDGQYIMRDERFNRIVKWMQDNSPDIVFLQETWNYRDLPTIAHAIARATGYDLAFRIAMGLPTYIQDGNAVLTKKSLKMSGEEDLKLPHSAIELGNGKTWAIGLGIVSTAVGVKVVLPNGDPAYVYTTHLLGTDPNQRADQIKS